MEHAPTVLRPGADLARPLAGTGEVATAQVVLTRIAQASVLLDFGGCRILTDPWFSERWGYYHGEPYGIRPEELPRLDGVLVSHDHVDLFSFKRYPDKRVPMLVKRGLGAKARAAGFNDVRELDAWETAQLGSVRVTATPGKHKVPEITFALQGSGLTVCFGADTLLIPELGEVARRFPRIDLALVPVNGLSLRPLLNRQVAMNAREAAELCALLRPRVAVPIHYAFTGGPIQDRLVLKYTGTAEEFAREAAQRARNERADSRPGRAAGGRRSPAEIRVGARERANARLLMRAMDEVFNGARFAAVDELYAPDFVNHVPPSLGPDVHGGEHVSQHVTRWRSAMPDLVHQVEDVRADRDVILVRWRADRGASRATPCVASQHSPLRRGASRLLRRPAGIAR